MALSKPTNNEMAQQLFHCGPVLEDNLDLIIIILSYLPVKSIGRFMAVCKSWDAVIRKRFFIETQLSRSRQNPQHVVFQFLVLRPTVDRPLSTHSVIASWNGLVFQHSQYSLFEQLSICNPGTRQIFYLPDDKDCPYGREYFYGVAYGPRCYDYKVYKFVQSPLSTEGHECRMYSSITEGWKSLGLAPACPLYNFHVCLNGTVYWQISKGREDYPGGILSIDDLGNFRTFDPPELGSGWPYLVSLSNSLGLVVIYKEVVGVSRMCIWVLESPLPIWTKKLETFVPLFPLELTVSASAWWNKVVITTPRRYLTYYMDKKMWLLNMSADVNDNDRSTFSGFFTESLLPSNGVMEP